MRLCLYSCKVFELLLSWGYAYLLISIVELTERGAGRAIIRLTKYFTSLSSVFEVFSTQIYCHSILSNLNYGGARYIATGRGFATSRVSFSTLYSRFAGPSIYFGMRTLIMLLYVTLSLWIPHLIYFWITTLALYLSPFIFNPHQFSFADFVIDYRYEKADNVQLFSVIQIHSTGNTSDGCLVVMLGYIRMLVLDIVGYLGL